MGDTFDSKYEFNAPKYIDFLQGDVDEDADRWFDERDGDEGGIDIDMIPFYEQAMEENGFQNATSAISAALKENDVPVDNTNKKQIEAVSPKQENQECTSKEPEVEEMDTAEIEHEVAAPTSRSEPKDAIKAEVSPQKEISSNKEVYSPPKESNDPESDKDTNNKKKSIVKHVTNIRKSNIRTSWNSPGCGNRPVLKRNQSRRSCTNNPVNYCDTKKRKSTMSEESVVLSKKHKPEVKLSCPETPSFVRKLRERGMKRGQSSEALQLNKIKEMQKQTRENVRKNEKKMKQALKAGPYVPIKSADATRPVEFHFESDKRLKSHVMQTRSDSTSYKTFQSQLRQHPSSPTFKKEPTKPKPFNFILTDKTSVLPNKKWESMAQFAMNYQTKTPERFRLKPKTGDVNNMLNGDDKKQPKVVKLTTAKTPQLMTKKRARAVTVESADQIEEKVADEMRKHKFKATEFNPKIIEKQGMYGVKKLPESVRTEVKPFRFQSDARLEQRKQKAVTQESEAQLSKAKVNTLQNGKTELHRPRKTEVRPFSFENRDKERYQKKEEKIKEFVQKEEKMHEFHARPLPSFSPDVLPAVPTKEFTKPEPFKISSGSTAYQNKFQQQMQSMEEEEKSNRQFKAKEPTVTKKEPFKPIAGLLPPTNVQDVVLNSDVRAKERAKFEEWKHEQEVKMEEEKQRFQRGKEEEEEERIKQLRKEAVPKAHGVRHFKPVEIQKSLKPLTIPHTPNFESSKRATMRL